MTDYPDDSPAAHLDRYLANVKERPRHQPKPVRWWHWLPSVAVACAVIAITTRMLRLW